MNSDFDPSKAIEIAIEQPKKSATWTILEACHLDVFNYNCHLNSRLNTTYNSTKNKFWIWYCQLQIYLTNHIGQSFGCLIWNHLFMSVSFDIWYDSSLLHVIYQNLKTWLGYPTDRLCSWKNLLCLWQERIVHFSNKLRILISCICNCFLNFHFSS